MARTVKLAVPTWADCGRADLPALVRWNGTSWSALGSGVGGMPACVPALPGGAIVLAGTWRPRLDSLHPALLGATVFHQVLSLELDAMGAPLTLGGTGAVAASLGAMW